MEEGLQKGGEEGVGTMWHKAEEGVMSSSSTCATCIHQHRAQCCASRTPLPEHSYDLFPPHHGDNQANTAQKLWKDIRHKYIEEEE